MKRRALAVAAESGVFGYFFAAIRTRKHKFILSLNLRRVGLPKIVIKSVDYGMSGDLGNS
jgi:hypothetical protein